MNINLSALDAQIQKLCEKKHIPGMAVCMEGPNGFRFAKGYGRCSDAQARPVDENTMFGIASMSKSTVALALAMLQSEGKVSFQDPVVNYIPAFAVPGVPKECVLIKHLATHTSGLPPLEPLEWAAAMNTPAIVNKTTAYMRSTAPNEMRTIEQVMDYIQTNPHGTVGAPGETFSYSNDAYAVLCYIVDVVAGVSLEEFLAERVFGPLGMHRTVLDVNGEKARALAQGNITSLYELDENNAPVCDDFWEIMPQYRACACVKSTAPDMARYYRCLANRGVLDGEQVLPRAAVDAMVGLGFALQEQPVYCYGLYKRLWNGHTVCDHAGSLHGVSSHGAFVLDEGWGFAVLTNLGCIGVDDICNLMLDAALGYPIGCDHEWLHERNAQELSDPARYCGSFICHEAIPEVLRIAVCDGTLTVIDAEGKAMPLCYCGDAWFKAYSDEGELSLRVRVLIRHNTAWGLRAGSRVFLRQEGSVS